MKTTLRQGRLIGTAELGSSSGTPLPDASTITAHAPGDGIEYHFTPGSLEGAAWLTADLLLDGTSIASFLVTLQEGLDGPAFTLRFFLLPQCQARIRMPFSVLDLNTQKMPREGAWLKPKPGQGSRVDLAKVDRMAFTVSRKDEGTVRWHLTDFAFSDEEPERVLHPVLPKGPLIDELGQSMLHTWPGKSKTTEDVSSRLQAQYESRHTDRWPETYSRWGGDGSRTYEATGYFRTANDGKRWWLVDPDGHPFWSVGVDCVRLDVQSNFDQLEDALSWIPDRGGAFAPVFTDRQYRADAPFLNYLVANLIRAFGEKKWYPKWADTVVSLLRSIGFNTFGNWSDYPIAQQCRFPYVRPLELVFTKTPYVFRDLPDVYDPRFENECATIAQNLSDVVGDPACIGYFLGNEPRWLQAKDVPAEGLLFNTTGGPCRRELSRFLKERYRTDGSLSSAWKMDTSLTVIAEGPWRARLTDQARNDLREFSSRMVERFYGTLSAACRAVDSHHLNLGARFVRVPEDWVLSGMTTFDVFGMNFYHPVVPRESIEHVSESLGVPVIIGEYHFGALDAGLPAPGYGHVRTQLDRGRAYRRYVEHAASHPAVVGTHWFTLYDESALGRYDGENYNIGFLDVCHRVYPELSKAARDTHERIYRVAEGKLKPYSDLPEYLPILC